MSMMLRSRDAPLSTPYWCITVSATAISKGSDGVSVGDSARRPGRRCGALPQQNQR
jgi:hypothetical protein